MARYQILPRDGEMPIAEYESVISAARRWVGIGPAMRRDLVLIDAETDRPLLVEVGPDWYHIAYGDVEGGTIASDNRRLVPQGR